jgi:hypothetical protein
MRVEAVRHLHLREMAMREMTRALPSGQGPLLDASKVT